MDDSEEGTRPSLTELRAAKEEYADLLAAEKTAESQWQSFFATHPYVLSTGLPLKLSPRDIQPRARPGVAEADFHIYPHHRIGGDAYGVIELKRPDSLIATSPRKDIVLLSRDAETAIAQALKDAESLWAKIATRPDRLIILGNQFHLFVIMGLSHILQNQFRDEFALARLLQRLPPGLQIIPYDTLYAHFARNIPAAVHFLVPTFAERRDYRLLIVDSEDVTLKVLTELIHHEVPRVEIIAATTVREGLEALERAVSGNLQVDVLIQDCRLPREKGYISQVNWEICNAVRLRSPSSLIVHVSAYMSDPQIKSHLIEGHMNTRGRSFVIDKVDGQWPELLVRVIKEHLYGRSIEEQIDDLFADSSVRRVRLQGPKRSRTSSLSTLVSEIESYWGDLGEDNRSRIREFFNVEEAGSHVTVTLR